MNLKKLNKYYTFRLSSYMDADELGNDTSLLVCRCSVFPKFLVSYEELIEKVVCFQRQL